MDIHQLSEGDVIVGPSGTKYTVVRRDDNMALLLNEYSHGIRDRESATTWFDVAALRAFTRQED